MAHKFKIGDEVIINNKYGIADKYRLHIFVVASDPLYDTGHECVKLKGTRGVWRTDGLDLYERRKTEWNT